MDIAVSHQGAAQRPAHQARPAAIANWLLFVALLVFGIVVVGGITRLTESGLSITEWRPITGALPPLSDAAWAAEFEKYKQIPEYIEINGPAGMTLAQFKFIYFWEWVHRLIGRLIGIAFALPFLWFWFRRAIPAGYLYRLLALFALGGLQGTIGWWMVSSGLAERTDVSHYRLAAHLLTALFILGGLVWTALDLKALAHEPAAKPAKLTGFAFAVLAILGIQLLLGAWVAGLNAGYVSSTWPLMNDRFFPEGVDWARGAVQAAVNDPFLTHFLHRWWAWVAVIALIMLARRTKAAGARPASIAIHSAFGVQILLGIGTVLSGMNIVLAVLHQAVGALLVASAVWGAHAIGKQAAAGG
jgi:heme a synthase